MKSYDMEWLVLRLARARFGLRKINGDTELYCRYIKSPWDTWDVPGIVTTDQDNTMEFRHI